MIVINLALTVPCRVFENHPRALAPAVRQHLQTQGRTACRPHILTGANGGNRQLWF